MDRIEQRSDDVDFRGILTMVVLLMASAAWGQEGTEEEPRPGSAERPLVYPVREVTASRIGIDFEENSASTSVVAREEIDRLAPASTEEILRSVPGLQVTGGGDGPAYLHLRGADPNLTLILVDGVAVNDPTDSRGGSFDLRSIDPQEIERIEVVRGPVSAVHGSDALAGVVQILTRRGQRGAWGELRTGGDDYRALTAGLSLPAERAGLRLQAHHREGGEAIDAHDFQSRGVGLRGWFRPGPAWRLEGHFRFEDSDETRFPQDSGGPELAVSPELETEDGESLVSGLSLRRELGDWGEVELRGQTHRRQRDLTTPAIAPGVRDAVPASRSDDELQRDQLGVDLRVQRPGWRLALGTETEWEQGSSLGLLQAQFPVPTDYDTDRQTHSVYAEALYHALEGVNLQAALRLDAPDGEDSEWTPRVGISYRVAATGTRVQASAAEGFKLPSFFALSHPLVGNADLDPERSESLEAGVEQELLGGRLTFGAAVFATDYTDLIDFDADAFQMVNRDEVTSRGFELSGRARLTPAFTLGGEWSRAETEVETTGEPLLDRPEWKGSAFAHYRTAEGHGLQLRVLYVGEVPDSSVPTGRQDLAPYARLDLSGEARVQEGLTLRAAVENLLDTDYDDAVGFPGRGIFAHVGLRGRI